MQTAGPGATEYAMLRFADADALAAFEFGICMCVLHTGCVRKNANADFASYLWPRRKRPRGFCAHLTVGLRAIHD
jgi:hypothetical protein